MHCPETLIKDILIRRNEKYRRTGSQEERMNILDEYNKLVDDIKKQYYDNSDEFVEVYKRCDIEISVPLTVEEKEKVRNKLKHFSKKISSVSSIKELYPIHRDLAQFGEFLPYSLWLDETNQLRKEIKQVEDEIWSLYEKFVLASSFEEQERHFDLDISKWILEYENLDEDIEKVAVCPGCNATNVVVSGKVTTCEYCGRYIQ